MKSLVFGLLFSLLFCPFGARAASPSAVDSDADGLSDVMEVKFKCGANNSDSDSDGYSDGLEINNGYNPLRGEGMKLEKKITINTKTQKLQYLLGGVSLGEFVVSTGKKSTPTPKGEFVVKNKSTRAWSGRYKLWMPYWLGLSASGIGIHELPEWGNGIKEGASHLGTPASHGCIRLGVGSAKTIYNFAEVGTKVKID